MLCTLLYLTYETSTQPKHKPAVHSENPIFLEQTTPQTSMRLQVGCMNMEEAALTLAAPIASHHPSKSDHHERKSSFSQLLTESELKEFYLRPDGAPIDQRSLLTGSARKQACALDNCTINDEDTRGLRSSKVSDIPNFNKKELLGSEGASCSSSRANSTTVIKNQVVKDVQSPSQETSGRERLKRHRVEVAGRVWIPEIWGQEELLKDWIDCTAFDSFLAPQGILSARAALVKEGRGTNTGGLGVDNSHYPVTMTQSATHE